MRKGSLLTIAVAMVIVLGAGVANAGTLKMMDGSPNYRSSSGGEFGVDITDAGTTTFGTPSTGTLLTNADFHTFCVEKDRANLSFTTYSFNTTDNRLTLQQSTAALYAIWYAGLLPYYEYTPGAVRAADAAEFQTVLWYFQGGGAVDVNGAVPGTPTIAEYLDGVNDTQTHASDSWSSGDFSYNSGWSAQMKYWIGLGQYFADNSASGEYYGTHILYLVDSNNADIQAQLMNDGGGLTEIPQVPLPSAALTGLALLGGLGFCYRLRRRRASV
jgi:hypothetical protein